MLGYISETRPASCGPRSPWPLAPWHDEQRAAYNRAPSSVTGSPVIGGSAVKSRATVHRVAMTVKACTRSTSRFKIRTQEIRRL